MDIYPDLPGELQEEVYRGLSPIARRALAPKWDPRMFSLTHDDILQTLDWKTIAQMFLLCPEPTIQNVDGEYLDLNTIHGSIHGVCSGFSGLEDVPFEYKFIIHLNPYSSKGILKYQHRFYGLGYGLIGVYDKNIYTIRSFRENERLVNVKIYYQLSQNYYLNIEYILDTSFLISVYDISRNIITNGPIKDGKCGKIRYEMFLPNGDAARAYRAYISEAMEWYRAWIDRILPWPAKPKWLTMIDSRCFQDFLRIPFKAMYPVTRAAHSIDEYLSQNMYLF